MAINPAFSETVPALPDSQGHFGLYGGRYVPETLMPALFELEEAFRSIAQDEAFQSELRALLQEYSGRPTPLYHAKRFSQHLGGAQVYFKREDLNHTGAHKINNTLGQILLARRMGKARIIAETGAGQHGVATATVCALFGMKCVIYMGEEDTQRQRLNVFRMKLLGAEVVSVDSGSRTLKDAMNEAIRDWVTNVRTTHYIIGSVAGPHPYPMMVRDFQSIIGEETKRQIQEKSGRLPDYLVACVGGGSNAMGLFYPFYRDCAVTLIGVEAAGRGLDAEHAAPLNSGEVGVLHGCKSFLVQNPDGQIAPVHSISAGLDYPGVGPELAYYKHSGRAQFTAVTDAEALEGFTALSQYEGIIPALESSHAVAHVMTLAPSLNKEQIIIINLSGRGDKDVESASNYLKDYTP